MKKKLLFFVIRQSEFLNELTILEAELTGINHWYIGLTDLGNKRSRKKGIFGLPGHEEGYVAWPRRGVCGPGGGVVESPNYLNHLEKFK